jgi:hypothetical protein
MRRITDSLGSYFFTIFKANGQCRKLKEKVKQLEDERDHLYKDIQVLVSGSEEDKMIVKQSWRLRMDLETSIWR